jgi:hypothetical protein
MKLATIESLLTAAKADYAKRGLSNTADNRKVYGWWKTHRNRIEKALMDDGADFARARNEANRQMATLG